MPDVGESWWLLVRENPSQQNRERINFSLAFDDARDARQHHA
jgi:hypothetical protein